MSAFAPFIFPLQNSRVQVTAINIQSLYTSEGLQLNFHIS